jgi:hypothetical protein
MVEFLILRICDEGYCLSKCHQDLCWQTTVPERDVLTISSFLIPSGLKSMWPSISKTNGVSLYSF